LHDVLVDDPDDVTVVKEVLVKVEELLGLFGFDFVDILEKDVVYVFRIVEDGAIDPYGIVCVWPKDLVCMAVCKAVFEL